MEEGKGALAQSMIDAVHEIASISGYRGTTKRQCGNPARRLRLLTPLFEETKDSKESMPGGTIEALASLVEALSSANELLRFGTVGSKIYHLVSEREQIMNKYHEVTSQLEQALNGISHENLHISDEVKGQVELVLGQLRGAKGGVDSPDVDSNEELLALYNQSSDTAPDRAVLRRLAEELELMKIKQESLAEKLEIFALCASGGDPGDSIERISMLLKKIKDFMKTENLDMDPPPGKKNVLPSSSGSSVDGNKETPVIPDLFRCPISLKLMKDPVVVSTGQTYERSSIEKWLEAGHGTCPRTQQTLSSTTLAPNGVLRSLIAQWHEANGIQPPGPSSSSRPTKTISAAFPANCAKIEQLLCKLGSGNPEEQRKAAGEIRLLAKRNAHNRVAIAEAGAIPFLARLLLTRDLRIQEHAVTALFNLSICYENKGNIVSSGAVPGIVHVLRNGSMEARENAAATLFSLSAVDEYKVTIGASGAIPPLVLLLDEGTQRGKKDAAAALFNLCIYRGNKGKAVRAGIVPTLMQLLTEPGGGMADEALAVLAIIASHTKGRAAIGAAKAVPVLVEIIRVGFPWNKDNAAAVLVHLCAGEQHHLSEAKELGIVEPLVDLAQNGTDRGKRKAAQLLERLSRFGEQQQEGSGTGQSRGRGSGTGCNRG